MKQNRDSGAIHKVFCISQLRAMGSLSVVFFLAVAVLWVFDFSGSAWHALLALSLAAFSVSWVAAVFGVQTSTRQLAQGKAGLHPRRETAVEVARGGLLLGVFVFVVFFINAS